MPWCPVCRNEYVEGKTHCPDCDVDLVETLPAAAEDLMEEMQDYKPYEFPEDFTMQDLADDLDGTSKKPEAARRYKSPETRYADARSSGVTFLLVGGLGLLAMILVFTGVFKLPVHTFAEITMTVLFIAFLVIGGLSLKSSGKIKEQIQEEHKKIREITAWYKTEGCLDESLSSLTGSPDEAPEVRYLQKYEALRSLLKEKFPETDEALLDKLASDFCEES